MCFAQKTTRCYASISHARYCFEKLFVSFCDSAIAEQDLIGCPNLNRLYIEYKLCANDWVLTRDELRLGISRQKNRFCNVWSISWEGKYKLKWKEWAKLKWELTNNQGRWDGPTLTIATAVKRAERFSWPCRWEVAGSEWCHSSSYRAGCRSAERSND